MTEIRTTSDLVNMMREQLGQDGHLMENAVSLLVASAAEITDNLDDPVSSGFKAIDAAAGKADPKLAKIFERLPILTEIIGNDELVKSTYDAALLSSKNQKRELKEAFKKGFSDLRTTALRMTVSGNPGEPPITLASKIQSLPPKR